MIGLIIASVLPALAPSNAFALHNGDRVVWYGDSITDNSPYCRYAEAYVTLHYPNLKVRYFNAGVGGDRVTGGWMGPIDQRMTRDLFSRKPTVITNMLGMNDAGYRPLDDNLLSAYEKGYQHMVDRIKQEAPKARVWLFLPSPFDDVTRHDERNGDTPYSYNDVLLKYADYVSNLAQKNGYGSVDQNAPLMDVLTKAEASNADLAKHILNDRVHPGPQADLIMAEQVLKAWGAPSVVDRVEIDAASGKATTDNARVSSVSKDGGLAWSETDGSLPFPIPLQGDNLAALVLASSDFDQSLDRQTLVVKGLAPGDHTLTIDGKSMGSFSADQFASGLNLELMPTPMMAQASKVLDLTNKECDLWYQRWRQLDFTLQDYPSSELEASKRALDAELSHLSDLEHAAAQPTPHQYQIN